MTILGSDKIPSVAQLRKFHYEVNHNESDRERITRQIAKMLIKEFTGRNTMVTWFEVINKEIVNQIFLDLNAQGWDVETWECGDCRYDSYPTTNFKIWARLDVVNT